MTQWGLDTLFNPAKRHMDEEKRRLQSTRQEIGDASGGRRIDLESGKVVIERSGDEDDDTEATDAASADQAEEVDEAAKAKAARTAKNRAAREARLARAKAAQAPPDLAP